MKVNVLEAKNRLSELIRVAHTGEEVVIANRGEPVARLVSVRPAKEAKLPLGHPTRILAWLESHPLPASLQRPQAAIDADIAGERDGWD